MAERTPSHDDPVLRMGRATSRLDNRYGHPTAETLSALAGVPTYRTDRNGTVEVRVDGARLSVHAHANGLGQPREQGIPRLAR